MRLRRSFLFACRSLTSTSLALLRLGSKWFCRERNIALDGMCRTRRRSQSRRHRAARTEAYFHEFDVDNCIKFVPSIAFSGLALSCSLPCISFSLHCRSSPVWSGVVLRKLRSTRPKAKTSRAKILATSASARGAHAPRAPRCPFLALSGRANRADECPPWGNNDATRGLLMAHFGSHSPAKGPFPRIKDPRALLAGRVTRDVSLNNRSVPWRDWLSDSS